MMRRPPASRKRQNTFSREMASDFDEAPLHNKVADAIDQDGQLARVLDAAARADEAADVRAAENGSGAEFVDNVEEAWGLLSNVARERALEVVAEACRTVIEDGDQWAAEGHWTESEIADAQHEAREWLQLHTNIAIRLGLLEEVSA